MNVLVTRSFKLLTTHKSVHFTKVLNKSFSLGIVKMEKAIEDLEKNPYFDKYADKIASLQKYVLFKCFSFIF